MRGVWVVRIPQVRYIVFTFSLSLAYHHAAASLPTPEMTGKNGMPWFTVRYFLLTLYYN